MPGKWGEAAAHSELGSCLWISVSRILTGSCLRLPLNSNQTLARLMSIVRLMTKDAEGSADCPYGEGEKGLWREKKATAKDNETAENNLLRVTLPSPERLGACQLSLLLKKQQMDTLPFSLCFSFFQTQFSSPIVSATLVLERGPFPWRFLAQKPHSAV